MARANDPIAERRDLAGRSPNRIGVNLRQHIPFDQVELWMSSMKANAANLKAG
jgi:hypothetical protein